MKILITGGTGCIGASTIHKLLHSPVSAEIERIVVTSRSSNTKLLQLWQGKGLDPRIEFESVDLSDAAKMTATIKTIAPTHIVHLGALQSPACDADPLVGMQINLGGTMALLDAVRDHCPQLKRFVFASSAAVYGKRAMYSEPTIPETVPLAPPNLYGIWKEAGEHLARLFFDQTNIPTVCLRLNTTYGPGRDQGKTSAPTTAIKHVASGVAAGKTIRFEMPYRGRENYHFVEDVGAHFAGCCVQPFEGFGSFNIKGQTIEIVQFLDTIRQAAEEAGCGDRCELSISESAAENLFVYDLEDDAIDAAFPGMPRTSIEDGVRSTLGRFIELAQAGELHL